MENCLQRIRNLIDERPTFSPEGRTLAGRLIPASRWPISPDFSVRPSAWPGLSSPAAGSHANHSPHI